MTMTTRCEAERHYRLYRPIYFYEPSLPWYCFIVITNIILMIIVNIILMIALMMSTININAYRCHQENLMLLLHRDHQHHAGDHQNYLWSRSTSWWLSKLIAITARTWALLAMILKLECSKVLYFLLFRPTSMILCFFVFKWCTGPGNIKISTTHTEYFDHNYHHLEKSLHTFSMRTSTR